MQLSNSTSGQMPGRTETGFLRDLCTRALRSLIHNCWNTKGIQIPTDGGISKKNVVCPCNGVPFSLEKEEDSEP